MQQHIFQSPTKTFTHSRTFMNPETPEAPQKGFCLGKSSADKQDHYQASEWSDGQPENKNEVFGTIRAFDLNGSPKKVALQLPKMSPPRASKFANRFSPVK